MYIRKRPANGRKQTSETHGGWPDANLRLQHLVDMKMGVIITLYCPHSCAGLSSGSSIINIERVKGGLTTW